MLNDLIKIADSLDKKGLRDEAGRLDSLMAQNAQGLRKLSGPRHPEMEHEMHDPIEETPEFMQHQAEEEYRRDLEAAHEVARYLILGKTPQMIEEDLEDEATSLADVLVGTEHMSTVYAIKGFLGSV